MPDTYTGPIIDSHAHLDEVEMFGWRDTPDELITLMDAVGIDRSVVTTYADEPGPEDGVTRLQEYVGAYPDRFIGFPRMDPRWGVPALDTFERMIVEEGMGGLKLHPVSNLSSPYAGFTLEIMDRAAELDVPVLIHSGDENFCLPRQIGRAAAETDATILLAHCGGFFNARSSLPVAAEHDNVILESSAFPYPSVLQEAVDTLGADRVIYGSDMPPANPRVELRKIDLLDIDEQDRERILYGNASRMLDIEVAE